MEELVDYYKLIADNYVNTLAVKFCRVAATFSRIEMVGDFDKENESYTILIQNPVTGDSELTTFRFIDVLDDHLIHLRTNFLEVIRGMSTYNRNKAISKVEELLIILESKSFRDDYKKTISDHLFLIKTDLGSRNDKRKKKDLNTFGFTKNATQLQEAIQNLIENGVKIIKDPDQLDYIVKLFTTKDLSEFSKSKGFQEIQIGCETKVFANFVQDFDTHFKNNLADVIEQTKLFRSKVRKVPIKKSSLTSSSSNKPKSKNSSESKSKATDSKFYLEILAASQIIT